MKLDAYLRRIDYQSVPRCDLATLFAIHRAHLIAISYENLDIFLGRVLSLDVAQIYEKIVERGRGGWCYEMNSLLAWALTEIGFDVTMLGARVGEHPLEDRYHLDHMALWVKHQGDWLLDAGFGNAFLEPLPLREGVYQQGCHTFRLQRDGDYWRFVNHQYGGSGFDFLLQGRAISEYQARCTWSQSAPESHFTQRITCHRLAADHSIFSLRGLVLTAIDAGGIEKGGRSQTIIENQDAFSQTLTQRFSLCLGPAEIDKLWQFAWPAHLAWLQTGA